MDNIITLRPLREDDADIIVKFNNNTDADFLSQWAGRGYVYPFTREQISERIKNTADTRYFTVLLNDSVIGTVELDFIKWDEKVCTVCRFLICEEYRGRGYGVKVLDLLCAYAFDELGMKKVRLSVFDFNTGAYKCYIKAGFKTVSEAVRSNGWKAIEMIKINGELAKLTR